MFWGGVFIASLLIYWPANYVIGWDMTTYISGATDLWLGKAANPANDLSNTSRKGYISLLALLNALPGEFLFKLVCFQVAFCALFTTALGLFTQRVWGLFPAIATVILWLGNAYFAGQIPRLIDPIWPTLILLSLIIISAPRDERPRMMVACCAAGILGGLAFTIKEVAAAPFLLVPLFAYIFGVRERNLKELLCFYTATVVAVFFIKCALFTGSPHTAPQPISMLQRLTAWISREVPGEGMAWLANLVAAPLKGLWYYCFENPRNRGVASALPLFPIMLTGCAWLCAMALRNDKRSIFACLVFLAALPLAAIAGLLGLRLTQDLPLIGIGYGAAAAMLYAMARALAGASKSGKIRIAIWTGLGVILLGGTVFQAVDAKPAWSKTYRKTALYNLASGTSPAFKTNIPDEKLADWLNDTVPSGARIMAENVALRHTLHFYAPTQYTYKAIPFSNIAYGVSWPYYPAADGTGGKRFDFIALSTAKPGLFNSVMLCLRAEDLRSAIEENGIKYIVLSGPGFTDALRTWLVEEMGFTPVTERTPDNRFWISIVLEAPEKIPEAGHAVFMDENVRAHIHSLAENNQKMAADYYISQLSEVTGISAENLKTAFENGNTPDIEFIQRTTPRPRKPAVK